MKDWMVRCVCKKIGWPGETFDGQLTLIKEFMARCNTGWSGTTLDFQVKDWMAR
jgi:hypothetical protein